MAEYVLFAQDAENHNAQVHMHVEECEKCSALVLSESYDDHVKSHGKQLPKTEVPKT